MVSNDVFAFFHRIVLGKFFNFFYLISLIFQLQEKRENSGKISQRLRDNQQQANDQVKVSQTLIIVQWIKTLVSEFVGIIITQSLVLNGNGTNNN